MWRKQKIIRATFVFKPQPKDSGFVGWTTQLVDKHRMPELKWLSLNLPLQCSYSTCVFASRLGRWCHDCVYAVRFCPRSLSQIAFWSSQKQQGACFQSLGAGVGYGTAQHPLPGQQSLSKALLEELEAPQQHWQVWEGVKTTQQLLMALFLLACSWKDFSMLYAEIGRDCC